MKEQLRILSQLQGLEQKKHALTIQKGKVDSEDVRRLWQEIRLLSQDITATRGKLADLEKICVQQEADLAAISKQCSQLEAKLYSGEITNLKEIEQVKGKCEAARKDIVAREEDALVNMENLEQLTALVTKDEKELQEKRRRHSESQQKISTTLAQLVAQLAEVEGQCRELASKVDPALLAKFKELSRKKPQPIARLENGICSGCRMSVPVRQTSQSHDLSYCDNCGRILLTD